MRILAVFVFVIFVSASFVPASVLAAHPFDTAQVIPAHAYRITQVDVRNLPESSSMRGPVREMPFLVPDPETFVAEKKQAALPGFVPPGEAEKMVVNSASSAPTSLSSNQVLSGVGGTSPNPCGCSPPDVDLGVSPGFVFEMVNLAGVIYTTSGSIAKNIFALSNFFNLATSNMTDPQILYDISSGRWFASIVDMGNDTVEFAVSTSSDPTGTWNLYSVSAGTYLPDQPFIGTNDDKLVISANDFKCSPTVCTTFKGVQYWILNKAELVKGAVTVDLATNAPSTAFFSVHPAEHLGSTGAFYMVSVGVGSTSTATLFTVTGVPCSSTTNPAFCSSTTLPTVITNSIAINPMSSPPNALQPGTSATLNTNDGRILSAVWETVSGTGTLWFSANDACVPNGDSTARSCLRVTQLMTSGSPSKGQDFDYASASIYLFYPAISLDSFGDLVVVYGASSSTLDPSLFSTNRLVTDSADTLRAPLTIASGTAYDSSGRYGDYFDAAPDMNSASAFWIGGEYRVNSVFQSWSTAIAQVTAGSVGFDFTLTNSGGIVVVPGGSGFNTITATLTSGSTQNVNLFCSTVGLPSGASCNFNPISGSPTFSSALTINTLATTPTGSYTVSAIGTGGSVAKLTSFTLTVNAPGVPTLNVNPTTVAPGGTITYTATGFSPNGLVTFYTLEIGFLGTATADSSGDLTGSYVVPTWSLLMTFHVYAVGDKPGQVSNTVAVTVAA